MESYRELIVWQKSMQLVAEVYRVTLDFPKHEIYGLTSQIRRAAVSIPSNIAEGHALKSTANYLRHVAIACGSLAELETQLEIAQMLGYLSQDRCLLIEQANEIGRILNGLRNSLTNKLSTS